MEPTGKAEGIDQNRRRDMSTAIGTEFESAANPDPSQLKAPTGDPVFETLNTRKEGAVLLAEIAARTAFTRTIFISSAKKFSGKYEHRLITGGIGHNLPQEALQVFAQ